jgi:hypothetical protein
MDERKEHESFIETARKLVYKYALNQLNKADSVDFKLKDVYAVWSCYILGNQKVLVSTNLPDLMYYEVTLDASQDQVYFDAYRKWTNIAIPMEDLDVWGN